MSYYTYDGDHGASFWKLSYDSTNGWHPSSNSPIHSWTNLKLIPFKRLQITPSKPNYLILQIPGTDDRIDITDYLPGGRILESRTGTFEFVAPPDAGFNNWADRYNMLKSYFDGSRFTVRLDDKRNTYYQGRLTFSRFAPGNAYSNVSIDYDIDAIESSALQ